VGSYPPRTERTPGARAGLEIRPYRAIDEPEVLAVIGAVWPGDPVMRVLQARHGPDTDVPYRRTRVAERDSRVVAAACATVNAHHPGRFTLRLNVAPDHRRSGVGTALLAEIRAATREDGRPLQVHVRACDAGSLRFAVRRGFRTLIRVRTGVIDTADPRVLQWVEAMALPPSGTRLVPLDHPDCTASRDDCVVVLDDCYVEAHAWDPPDPLSIGERRDHFLAQNVVPGSPVCAYDGDTLAGVGVLIMPSLFEDSDAWYLCDVGVSGQGRPHARELTGALAAHCLAHAARNGRRVEFEVDDSHPHLWAALETLPTAACGELLIMSDGALLQSQRSAAVP
jgi:GNAT superfamily N-acetyltransferase